MSDDADLIERARRGEPAAWRELYESLSGRLLVWLRTRPSGDAAASPEDLAAEAWLVAAGRIADFTGSTSDFAGWLFGIARNQSLNARRRTVRRATDPVDVAAHDFWGADLPTDVAGTDWVRHALASLPTREGEVLACMEVVGLDTAGTAAALGMSTAAVRVARHRGLRRLRGSLRDGALEPEGPAPARN